jgi:uncharacterized protein YqeY
MSENSKMIDVLNNDIKVAMKAKEKEKLQALRYMKSMLMENSTSKKPVAEMDVIVKHHKKLKESLENYPADHAMAIQTVAELKIVEAYLPQQLSKDEVVGIIKDIIANNEGANMGVVMKELQPQIKGRFDGKMASQLVKENLG